MPSFRFPQAPLLGFRLSAFYAAAFLVLGIQLPFWPAWLAERGLDVSEIGFVLAVAIWAKILTTPLLGALADRTGAHRAVMAALAALSLLGYTALLLPGLSVAGIASRPASFLPVALPLAFWSLLLVNLVASAAQSALMPLGESATLAAVRNHALDYGRVRLWGSASFILGALGSGWSIERLGVEGVLALVIGASTLLTAASLAMPAQTARPERGAGRDARRNGSAQGAVRRMLGEGRFWLLVLTAAALQSSHQLYYGFGTLYWRTLGFPDSTIGWLWAEGVVAEIVLFWYGRRLVARFGPLGLLAIGGLAGIVRWGCMGIVAGLPAFAALQLLHALTFGASHLGAMHALSRTVPPEAAASAQSVYAALYAGLGSGLVMLAAGGLYRGFGGDAFLFMALLSAAGLAGGLLLRRFDFPAPAAESGPARQARSAPAQ